MRARVLPRTEWDLLPEDVRAFAETFHPSDVAVHVVEDGSELVGRMLVYRSPHWEGYWLAPQAGAGVRRALLDAGFSQAAAWSRDWFLVHADDAELVRTLIRMGGQPLAVETFMLTCQRRRMEEATCHRQ